MMSWPAKSPAPAAPPVLALGRRSTGIHPRRRNCCGWSIAVSCCRPRTTLMAPSHQASCPLIPCGVARLPPRAMRSCSSGIPRSSAMTPFMSLRKSSTALSSGPTDRRGSICIPSCGTVMAQRRAEVTQDLRIHAAALLYFDAVRRAGSIREAARRLNVASSAVNRQILKLEAEIGAPLFDRFPDGIKLTWAGEAIARHVLVVLQDLDRARSDIEGLKGARI